MTPERKAAYLFTELRNLIDDASNRLPPSVGQVDDAILGRLRLDLSLAIGATYRVEDAREEVERCRKARQGMLADLGDAVAAS